MIIELSILIFFVEVVTYINYRREQTPMSKSDEEYLKNYAWT